jgi:hypothetical protein
MGLKIKYKHNHTCSREGQVMEVRPDSDDGVTFIRIPLCEETLLELEQVGVEKY